MLQFLSNEVHAGLDAARRFAQRRRSRLCIHVGDEIYPLLRYWQNGFALAGDHVAPLRGLVEIYDGPKHLATCLLMASALENGELICEFKRNTSAIDQAPLDYERDSGRPVALLPRKF